MEEVQAMQKKSQAERRQRDVFHGLVVFVGREVPFDPLYFCLRACGAEVGWPRDGSPCKEDADHITHHVIDRPLEQVAVRPGREYVQPQWVFDCLNEGLLLPIADYAPGKPPPPHLSPFVDHEQEGYVPGRREELSKLKDAAEAADAEDGEEGGEEDAEEVVSAELAAEFAGVPSSGTVSVQTQSRKAKATAAMQEEEERLKSMMTKKHKRMLLRIEQRQQAKDEKVQKLVSKRAKADKAR